MPAGCPVKGLWRGGTELIKAVAIDFDDTLCLSEAACFVMENAALERMGRGPMTREMHLRTWGTPLFEAILERSPGIDLDEFQRAHRPVIKEFTDSGKLDSIPEENFDVLDDLIEGGKTILILTSRKHVELTHMLKPDHLLSSRVQKFYHKDNTDYQKPDPRAFSEMLDDTGLKPEEIVYVGDSIGDVKSSKGAGLHFIASLESGLRVKEDFKDVLVDAFIERFTELVPAINSLI
jgi:phosphoglycolate phosphatase